MSKPAIELENVSKLYRLDAIGYGTLRETVNRWWDRMRNRCESALPPTGLDPAQAGPLPNTFWALRDVSATIERGQIVGVIGRNGAGKSTLLKVLSRITEPDQGRAVLRGTVGSLLEVGAGFHPELSGRENIFLNGAILGMRKAEISRRFDEIIDFAEVGAFIDTPVKRYSSGMYVRLAFAVAAHLEPDILIVDEVLAVGDARFQKKCLGKMQDISTGHGRTIIFVSHNLEAVQRLCSRCVLLQGGQIASSGATKEVIAKYLGTHSASAIADEWIDVSECSRSGTGDARFAKVRFSCKGNELAQPCSDGPIEFEFAIETTRPVPFESLAVAFMDELGRPLVNADIGALGQSFALPSERSVVRLRIDALHLKPGVYSVALWLARYAGEQVSGGDIIDWIEKAFEVQVVDRAAARWRTSIGATGPVTCEFKLLGITSEVPVVDTKARW